MLLQLLLQTLSITPQADVPSACNVTLNSDVLAYSQCIMSFSEKVTVDFNNRVVTVLSAPLDPFTCTRFVYRINRALLKNVDFYLDVTIEADERCPKQYFGVFDAQGLTDFELDNVRVTGNVYIDKHADATVGALFAFWGMDHVSDGSSISYKVPKRAGGTYPYNVPSMNTIRTRFNVGYGIKVFKLKKQFFEQITQRVYTAYDYVEVTNLTNETSFTADEYKSDYFPYSNLTYETIAYTSGVDSKYGRSCAFSIYKGSELEEFPNSGIYAMNPDGHVPGIIQSVMTYDGFDETAAGKCLDAQMFSRGPRVEVDMSYDIYINSACFGCSCVLCPNLLVAKPKFGDVYCSDTCPQGSVRYNMICLAACPLGWLPDDEKVCHPTLCEGYKYMNSAGTCYDAYIIEMGATLPWPHRKVQGLDNNAYNFSSTANYTDDSFDKACPVVFGFYCYESCPPGYMTREVRGADSYLSKECHACSQYGLHGWYAGKCWPACPYDMVSENDVCVPKCSSGLFDDAYFCLPYCRTGYAFGGECLQQCPSGSIIGREIRQCFHNCPSNMQLQDGVCVYACDYGLEYNEELGKCSPCSSGFAWLDTRCVKIGVKDCMYQTFDSGILKCLAKCQYGQLRNGTLCVTLDKEQGNFVSLDVCNLLTFPVWNEQFYCYLQRKVNSTVVNIHELHKISECEFASMDIGENGDLSNASFAYNVTMAMPQECSSINITLFAKAHSFSNITILGKINITNTRSAQQVKYAITQNVSVFDSENKSKVHHNLTISITGGSLNVTNTLYDNKVIESEAVSINETVYLTSYSVAGKEIVIYANKTNTSLIQGIPAFLEFIADIDNLKLAAEGSDDEDVIYYTSAVTPKILNPRKLAVAVCDAGNIVKCDGTGCFCSSTIGASQYLYGIYSVSGCGRKFEDTEHRYCYDVCPEGYGYTTEQPTKCVQCYYYSLYGQCVKTCPGFAYGKNCVVGGPAQGFVVIDNATVLCGTQGTSPFFESGKCVERCSAGQSSHNGICMSICPQGSFQQYKEELGYSECVNECDFGFYQEDFVCKPNCSDPRFKKYRECRFDCDGVSFDQQCISKCPEGYINSSFVCKLCPAGTFYNVSNTTDCATSCENRYIVNVNGIKICCNANATSDSCKYTAGSAPQTLVVPSFTDGIFEQQDCKFMNKSLIWGASQCILSNDNDFLQNKEVVNIIGMKMEQQVIYSGNIGCTYYVIDVDHFNINNVMFYFDVRLQVPDFCKQVTIAVFGNVDTANITSVSVGGSIEVAFSGSSVPLVAKHVLNAQSDNMTTSSGSVPIPQKIEIQSSLFIAGKTPTDYIGGEGFSTVEEQHTKKFGFGGTYHTVFYLGESVDELLQQYYAILQLYQDSADLFEYDDAYSSLRPLALNKEETTVITCEKGKVLDTKTRECVTACALGSQLLGTLCVVQQGLEIIQGHNNQIYTQCPRGTYVNSETGFCDPCLPSQYIYNGQCVDYCKDGLMKYGRICVVSCPANTYADGIYCFDRESRTLQLEDGLEVSHCGTQTANLNNSCLISCLPGQYIRDSVCVDSCSGKDLYIRDNYCNSYQSSTTANPCANGELMYTDLEGQVRCVVNCPDSYWAVNRECKPESDEYGCDDPMSYRNPILKRCVPCFVKKSSSQDYQCSDCLSINRTNPANLTHQYCQECSFFYQQQTESSDQLETKFCTDQCPPNPLFLTAEENAIYSSYKFPVMVTGATGEATECRYHCDSNKMSSEVTNKPQCTESCPVDHYTSEVFGNGKLLYKRCIKSCAMYPNENPVADGTFCRTSCQSVQKHRYLAKDQYGYDVYYCGASCNTMFQYNSTQGDIICANECPSGTIALKIGETERFECVSQCNPSDKLKFSNWANQTCVASCTNSALHAEVYLGENQCITSCAFYSPYVYDEEDVTAVRHEVNYQCVSSCNNYYLDHENRKICVESCPKFAKYRSKDADGFYQCVSTCPNTSVFINSGSCVSSCPEAFFTSEKVYVNNWPVYNKICITEKQCVDPLGREEYKISGKTYTHCTKCNEYSLTNSPYSWLNFSVLTCNRSCSFYTEELRCLSECPTIYKEQHYYKSLNDTKMCLKCITKDNQTCISTPTCPDYISQDNPQLCVTSCGDDKETRPYHIEFDSRNERQKVCGASPNCLIFEKDAYSHALCLDGCHEIVGENNKTTDPNKAYIPGFGCVSDCFEFGNYYPTKPVVLTDLDDGENYTIWQCKSRGDCLSEPGQKHMTYNVTEVDDKHFKPGACKAVNSTVTCTSPFYQDDGGVHRCLASCWIFPGIYTPNPNISQKCENAFSGSQQKQLYYNFEYKMFEQLDDNGCRQRGGVSTSEFTCLHTCPYQQHLQLDGKCHYVPTCLEGYVVKVLYYADGGVAGYSCVTLTSDMMYYYLDGVKYAGEHTCTRIGNSKECMLMKCPPTYFYLHGVCTKMCANRTADACVDTTLGSVFILANATSSVYTQIPAESCSSLSLRLVAQQLQGSVVFLCYYAPSSGYKWTSGFYLANSKQQNCALNTSAVFEGQIFFRQLCANMTTLPLYENNTYGYAISTTSMGSYKAMYNSTIGGYLTGRNATCSDLVCYGAVCTSEDEVLYMGKCIKRVYPTESDLYMMYRGRKHKISAADCLTVVEGKECSVLKCPTLRGYSTSESFYHEGICVTGCVRGANGNCQKYSKGNVFDSVTFAARSASQCKTLLMSADKENYYFSWKCSFDEKCPSSYTMINNKYCVLDSYFNANKVSKKLYFSDTKVPISQGDIFIADNDYDKCQMFTPLTFSGTSFQLCVLNYRDYCSTFAYNSDLKAFYCRSAAHCDTNEIDYLSSGLCITCAKGELFVNGKCVNVTTSLACTIYAIDGKSCKNDATSVMVVANIAFELAASSVARYMSYYGKNRAVTYAQPFVCPKDTHYYYAGACVRRCLRFNDYECQSGAADLYFNNELNTTTKPTSPQARIATIHIGSGTGGNILYYEVLSSTERCKDYQLTVGNKCMSKSLMLDQLDSFANCVATVDNAATGTLRCSTDPFACNTFVTVEIAPGKKLRICHKDNDQVDCDNSKYVFDEKLQRFECVASPGTEYTIDGRFYFPSGAEGKIWAFGGAVSEETALPDDTTQKYYMVMGKKYPTVQSASFVLNFYDTNMANEVAYFVCPAGFYYLENRCKATCPIKTTNATINNETTNSSVPVCERKCPFFFYGGGCTDQCGRTMYAKLVYMEPYINYICQETACLGTEYSLKHLESEMYPTLCLSKARDSSYPSIPANKVFVFNANPGTWDDLFVDRAQCTTFFVSQVDTKLAICADVTANVPTTLLGTLQYDYDFGMFQYRQCSFGYHVIESICYPSQEFNASYVLNDKMLKIYKEKNKGSYDVTQLTSDKYFKMGVCQLHQYRKNGACFDLPTVKSADEKCEFYYTRASYNQSVLLAQDIVYFLVNPEYQGQLDTVSSTSCQIATARCPTHLGYFYFDNVCIKKCAPNTDDALDKYTRNCFEYQGYDRNGKLVRRNIITPIDQDNENTNYTLYTGLASYIQYIQPFRVQQTITHIVYQYGIMSDDDSGHIVLKYDNMNYYISEALALSLPRKDCVIGIAPNATYASELCTLRCKVYDQHIFADISLMKCAQSLDTDEESLECSYLIYDKRLNMYQCNSSSLSCSDQEKLIDSRTCGVTCYAKNEVFIPGLGCTVGNCTGDFAYQSQQSVACSRIKDSTGTCVGFTAERESRKAFVQLCDSGLVDYDTCKCNTKEPCILGAKYFNERCVTQTTCANVQVIDDVNWACLFKCPDGYGKNGNLCQLVKNGDQYNIRPRQPLEKTAWYIALGGLSVFIVLGIGMLLNAFMLYRKVNANKALKKSKRDDKVGYHERLNKMNAMGGKKKAEADKAQKNVGRRTE